MASSGAGQERVSRKLQESVNAAPFVPQAATATSSGNDDDDAADESYRQSLQEQYGAGYPQATFQRERRPARPVRPVFMDESLRHTILTRQRYEMQRLAPEDPRHDRLPVSLHRERYHSLWPIDDLDAPEALPSSAFGFPTTLYKAVATKTGYPVCVRRIRGCTVADDVSRLALEPWVTLRGHPNIVSVLDVFNCNDFTDGASLCVVHELCPMSSSVHDMFLDGPRGTGPRLTADLLWSIYVQIVSALTTIHGNGLSCKVVDARHCLVLDPSAANALRVKLNACAIKDVLQGGSTVDAAVLADQQADDLHGIARVVLSVAVGKPFEAIADLDVSLQFVGSQFGNDLAGALRLVLDVRRQRRRPTIWDVSRVVSQRVVREMQQAYSAADALESDLALELQNGRLFRLVSKMAYICERAEFNADPHWSEHGDRYPIKLFRDYLFHQVDDQGNPVVDLALLVHCLNKVDAGVPEKMILSSRDQSTLLVLGFDDLKRCIETAFDELSVRKATPLSSATNPQLNVNAPGFNYL
ncbi:unnamed protein product (mitochondrion) [Plasmodiophora brassicae]|uniref:Pan3 C-terminal knob domain-containing protein n=1 Tax=Plasmodiophora brassicae TaxID=37360 RepID=A0A0G4ITK6_PLABS|nr:hypothetical protein PBRA_006565 [Plasmodiophora brassicae]SPQ94535.1 unnamed protein product [Plasmodiophora brassicae]